LFDALASGECRLRGDRGNEVADAASLAAELTLLVRVSIKENLHHAS
jgi:hypothetical protein